MLLNNYKELTPVFYGKSFINCLAFSYNDKICFQTHWHDRIEILLIDDGEMLLNISDCEYIAKKGAIVVINPRFPHKGIAKNGLVNYRVLTFEFQNIYSNHTEFNDKINLLENSKTEIQTIIYDDKIYNLVKDIFDINKMTDENKNILIYGQLYLLIGYLLKDYSHEREITFFKDNEVISYINENFCDDISTSSIANRFGYSEEHLCRIFKNNTGISIMKYIRILRLQKGQQLLKNGEKTVLEVSNLCGYTDANYFTRCFKKHFGFSPISFIKNTKKSL